MRSDDEIKREIEQELTSHPDLDSEDIAVAVRGGVVTLAGYVRSYADKYEAERTVKCVTGVGGIADDLMVRLPKIDERPDPDIAHDAVDAIQTELSASAEGIKVVVKDGHVTLEGLVPRHSQRQVAEDVVRKIKGVKDVHNRIQLKPEAKPDAIKEKIVDAFRRDAELDASSITVEEHDGEVVLRGRVRSWSEREEAERVAWTAPGVTNVVDNIAVAA